MRVLTRALIEESEVNATKGGIFSYREMMYRAGSAAADVIMRRFPCRGKKITVVCGRGNNGGDGFVIAAALSKNGAEVTVAMPLGEPTTENAVYYYKALVGVKTVDIPELEKAELVIDALFGLGLNRAPLGAAEAAIKLINAAKCPCVSVDIPSGFTADGGKAPGAAVKADLTVTFIAPKPCFFLPPCSDFCGETAVADIGVTPVSSAYEAIEAPVFQKRRHNSHKGSYGTALAFCGSYGMSGAAVLAARGALRSGLGIYRAVLCEGIYVPFTVSVPEAVCIPVPQSSEGCFAPERLDIPRLLEGGNALLVGCGMGCNGDTARLTRLLLESTAVPTVVDADGINALCGGIDIIKKCKAPVILTPHPGEMARLYGISASEVEANRITCAETFAREHGCVLVLKGANTIVASPDGKIAFNTTGNPGMATGGSGDVLAGITVSLLAQGMPPFEAAKAAVFLHGAAGDKAAARKSRHALLPSDLIEEL